MATKPIKSDFNYQKYAQYFIIIIPLVVYISTVRLGLTYFDDDMLLIDNYSKISQLTNIPKAFLSDAFFTNVSPYYRPMMNVSFILDTLIGQGNVGFYHFMNLIYHILACLLLYKFLLLLKFPLKTSLAAALLFSLHPVTGHAVMWIPARGDLLVTVFTLSSFILLIKYLDTKNIWSLVTHIILMAAAIFSKESAVVLPFLFAGLFLWRKDKITDVKKSFLYVGWIVVIGLWFYLRYITIDHRPDTQRGFDAIFSNLPFIPEAVARILFPINLPVTPVFSPLITFTGLVGILGLVIIFIFYRKTNKIIPIMYGAFWFLIFCAPNMFVRLASANDNFEYLLHRLYLPGVGFVIMVAGLMPVVQKQLNTFRPVAMVGILLALMAVIDFIQQPQYKNGVSFWTASTSYAPNRSWFSYYFGRYYFKKKDFLTYEKYLLKADSINSYPNFHYQLAMVNYSEKKDYELAFKYFKSAFSSKGYGDEEARKNFVLFCIESSNDLARKGKLSEAIARCQIALDNEPENEVAAYNLGLYVIGNGEKERAVSLWRQALAIKSDFKDPYKSLAIYYLYDRKLKDSAMFNAIKYKEYGGTEDLVGMIKSTK